MVKVDAAKLSSLLSVAIAMPSTETLLPKFGTVHAGKPPTHEAFAIAQHTFNKKMACKKHWKKRNAAHSLFFLGGGP